MFTFVSQSKVADLMQFQKVSRNLEIKEYIWFHEQKCNYSPPINMAEKGSNSHAFENY